MVTKVLIGVLVLAGLFLVYSIFMQSDTGMAAVNDLKKQRAALDKWVVGTGNVRAIETRFNTGPGHF